MPFPLRIGVIGAGAIATRGHLPAFKKLPDVEVIALCDTAVERAQAVAVQFAIPGVYADYRDLLAVSSIDAVTIALPNVLHAPVTISALEAGKHVLCEKPLATTLADGQMMVDAAARAEKVLAVNMHYRVAAELDTLRSAIAAGRLGRVRYVNIRFLRRTGIPGFGSWFTQRNLSGGGVLMDIGAHMLDLALWLQGFPGVAVVRGEVQSLQGPRGRGRGRWGSDTVSQGVFDVEDFASVHLRLAHGGAITVEVSWALYGEDEERVQVLGEEGGADLFPALYGTTSPLHFFRYEGESLVDIIPVLLPVSSGSGTGPVGRFADATRHSTEPTATGQQALWASSIARYVAAIRSGTEPTATGQQALEVMKVLTAAYRSAAEGHEVLL